MNGGCVFYRGNHLVVLDVRVSDRFLGWFLKKLVT